MDLLRMNNIAGDFKVLNLITGIGSSSSSYPYPYCLGRANDWTNHAPLRTIDTNIGNSNEWHQKSGREKDRQLFYSPPHAPI